MELQNKFKFREFDDELMAEFEKAFSIASKYAKKVSFRKSLLASRKNSRVCNEQIIDKLTSEVYLNAVTGEIDASLCNYYTIECSECGEEFIFNLFTAKLQPLLCTVCNREQIYKDEIPFNYKILFNITTPVIPENSQIVICGKTIGRRFLWVI